MEGQMLRSAVAAFGHDTFEAHSTTGSERVGANLALFEIADEHASGHPRSSRARLALRIDSGKSRRSSLSIASTSKARS
jgi:hypothetical protein